MMKQWLSTMCVLMLAAPALLADELKGGESYQIRNLEYGNLLRPLNASTQDGAPIVLYPSAPWRCMTWKCVPEGDAFSLQNLFSSKTLAAAGSVDGQPNYLVQVPWTNSSAERSAWTFVRLDDGCYRIADPKTGEVLTAVKDARHGVRVTLERWAGTPAQRWEVRKAPDKLTM